MNTTNDLTYIIRIQEPTKSVFVKALGMNRVDAEVEGWYPSTEVLPMWMQEKIVLLMMLHPKVYSPFVVKLKDVGECYEMENYGYIYTITS